METVEQAVARFGLRDWTIEALEARWAYWDKLGWNELRTSEMPLFFAVSHELNCRYYRAELVERMKKLDDVCQQRVIHL